MDLRFSLRCVVLLDFVEVDLWSSVVDLRFSVCAVVLMGFVDVDV